MLTSPNTTKATATMMPANSESTRIMRMGPGWRGLSSGFIALIVPLVYCKIEAIRAYYRNIAIALTDPYSTVFSTT
jgi:hypothetical protein